MNKRLPKRRCYSFLDRSYHTDFTLLKETKTHPYVVRLERYRWIVKRSTIVDLPHRPEFLQNTIGNRHFSYSTKKPGSSNIFIQLYTRGSIEWR